MILYIAEKPSLARAIAAALPSPQKKEEGCIWLPNGDCISWCIGHLLEQAEPHQYNPAYKSWSLDHLPIIPIDWQWQEKANTKKQLGILKKLIKKATLLVHAGDPDREGQLLVDEVLHYTKVPAQKLKNTQRLLVNDLTPSAIKKALSNLRSNNEFAALSRSALGRARADWLFGLNLTRAYTIRGRQAGYQGVLSIGRVQTPVLGLVAARDKERDAFVPKDFYQVWASVQTPQGVMFQAKWRPSEACQPYMDEENRVLSLPLAQNVAQRISNQPAIVVEANYKQKKQTPPLPYSLSVLQIDAAKAFSLSAQQVLDTCQALYERHQIITYPRSDCRYLPTLQHKDAPAIIAALARSGGDLQQGAQNADASRKSKAWNDKQVTAHHAIIPTTQAHKAATLSKTEALVFGLIARQYLMQFYPEYDYLASYIKLDIAGGQFEAKGSTPIALGWKALLPTKNQTKDPEDENQNALPKLSKNDELWCRHGQVQEKVTTAPAAFTDATLLAAMTGISRFVSNKDIRAILKETDGLGTEATRASIIELLFKRGFLIRQGKQIHASQTGRAFIDCLPEQLVTPDMTAQWESALNGISLGEASYQAFMESLESNLQQLLSASRDMPTSALQNLPASTKNPFAKRKSSTKKRTTSTRKTTSTKSPATTTKRRPKASS
ncbi:DNA topoisomerase III [Marinomonas sp. M1K-6]|uniref:DNA topoisomerase n=1 Tax=Marinomonas profundi TaxID=2726122 RepID=A0A847R6V8_9GAMM|nr:DNA topoisomerase III [Marinomonas profundi]NLQ16674.1 DNA topoisomerase III [Marinomonas profundi]UDV03749.1 DNA topoisomerase III [Marinomonas profundi]